MKPVLPAIALAALLATGSALAGTVQVVVTDDDGYPVDGVRLRLLGEGRTRPFGTTNSDGLVLFEDLPPGSYEVSIVSMPLAYFVLPADNHLDLLPSATLLEEDEAAVLELTLRRGIEVVSTLQVRGEERPKGVWVVYSNPEQGVEKRSAFGISDETSKTLLPGRWTVSLVLRPGYLLTGLTQDGIELPGATVEIEPGDTWRTTQLTWTVESHCQIFGDVADDNGGPTEGLAIVAELVEPGAWIDAARERGASGFDRAVTRVDREESYGMFVVSGIWRVRPSSDRLTSADPEFEELECGPGEEVAADFLVTLDDGEGGNTLSVRVRDPSGRVVGGATVGLWNADQDFTAPPFRTAETREHGYAWFTKLPPGDYRVVAGHPAWTHRTAEVQEFGEDDSSRSIRMTLGAGATIRTVATDEDKERVPGVLADIRWDVAEVPPELDGLGLADTKRNRQVATDATGVAEVKGLYAGAHEVRGRLPGERGRTHFVRIANEEARRLDLREGDLEELEARVLPAGALSGHLVCDDGLPVPAAASFRVLPFTWDRSGADEDMNEAAVVAFDREPLTGSVPDEFLLGPLENGVYFLATRPAGFDRWAWYAETEDPETASSVEANVGEVSRVYALRLACAPRLEIRPDPADGSPLPDLRDAEIEVRAFVPDGDGENPVKGVRVDRDQDFLSVHGLPAGEVRVEAVLRHPTLLPAGRVDLEHSFEAERGKVEEVGPRFAGVGGVVEWRGDVPAARLVRAETEPRLETPLDRLFRWETVPAGNYALELCADPVCSRIVSRIYPVTIVAGEVTRVTN